jgi:uncharacterized membrane protein
VKPEWYFPLVPLATLTTLSFATAGWFQRKPESSAAARNPLLQIAMVYRWLALVMSLIWIWDYVPERQRIWAYMLAAVVIFALAVWLRSREALVATAVYAFAALTMLWCRDDFVMDLYWPNLLSLLALFGLQQILRRMSPRLTVPEQIHSATIIIAGLALWRFLWCWAAQINDAYSVTMVWAGLAVVMFAAGIVLRERFHRWFGLGLLAAAVGRVVLVDVWTQETIWRVLTFMALGVALLVIGFVYNKYQEKIRQWL